jgi:hypothetical protein
MSQDSNIRQPVAEPCQDQQAEKRRDYDMDDCPNELQRWPKLAPVLCDLEAIVVAAYHRADTTSRKERAWHKVATIVAGLGGMFAVLFAIAQLPPSLPIVGRRPESVRTVEAVAAVVALFAVVVGLWAALSKKWLVEREKAERCRFLKFDLLISLESWGNFLTPRERQDKLRAQLKEKLETINWQSIRRSAARGDEPFQDTTSRVAASIDRERLEQLLEYYQEKRLCYQLQYLERQAERRRRWDELTRVLPLWLFFASIAAALLHFLYDVGPFSDLLGVHPVEVRVGTETQRKVEFDVLSLSFLMLAACLPIIGAAIRLLRTAHEFGRNTLRFRATSSNLKRLDLDLQKPTDSPAKLEILRKVEEVLKAERREWLRLMFEAEWFG